MTAFDDHVVSLDRMCHKFLDTAFNTLRSAEGAFEVLQRFQHMQSRPTIQKQLMQKFDAVLVRYGQEVPSARSALEPRGLSASVALSPKLMGHDSVSLVTTTTSHLSDPDIW